MNLFKLLSFITILLLILFVNNKEVSASHAQGAQITYTCVGPNQYNVTLAFFRDCDGISAPSTLTLEAFSPSGCSSATPSWTLNQDLTNQCSSSIVDAYGNPYVNGQEATPLCQGSTSNTLCNGGSYAGTQIYYYCTTITLPSQCPDWTIGYGLCCRNSGITNLASPASNDQYVYTMINNTNDPNTGQPYCNNSAQFLAGPNDYICPGSPYEYNHQAIDIDGDSLVYTSIAPLDDYGVPIGYVPGLSPSDPFNDSDYFNLNPATGQISVLPNGQQVIAITVLVQEFRNGVLIGETMRDVQIIVNPPSLCSGSNPPIDINTQPQGAGFLGNGSDSLQMCPGNTVTFTVETSVPGANDLTMSSNASIQINGSTFTISQPANDTAAGTFTWTPTIADTGFNSFTVSVTGCYANAIYPLASSVTYSIYVFDEVRVTPATATYCGDPIQLSALGGSSFVWTPSTGLSDDSIPNPIATPSVPTNYIATSDCGVDSVFINVSQPYAPDAGADTAICLNSAARIFATAPSQFGPYTYQWSPAVGLSNPNISSPLASPDVTTQYTVTTTSAAGCEKTDSITVSISGVAPRVTAFADPDTICPGQTIQLNLSVAPSQCGTSLAPCSGSTAYEIGTGTNISSTTSPYTGFWEAGRILYLFRASELNAMGLNGGILQEIAFYVNTKNSTEPYLNFNIRMGCTNADVVPSSFPVGLTNVYNSASETTTTGWNNYIFDNDYDWDGASNLYVEVCYSNFDYTSSDAVRYETTPFQSVLYDYTDNAIGCALNTGTVSSNRANTRFNLCVPSVQNATILWSPSTNMTDPSIPNPQAQVFSSTTFLANVTEGGCSGTGYVDVYVNQTIAVEAVPDTALCSSTPVQLNAITTGTPSPILLSCGANGTPCGSNNTVRTLGDATATSSNTSPFNSSFEDFRVQYLFRASELIDAGFDRGIFQNIGFEVTSKNTSAPFANFQVSMGCTNQDELSTDFITGLDVVFTPKDYTTVAGQNTIIFDNSFDWDGTSNIVINICFDNPFLGIGQDIIRFTPTGYNSVMYGGNDFTPTGGCGLDASSGIVIETSEFRPDITIDMCDPPPGQFTYQWTPGATLDDDTLQNPIATPLNSEVYHVTVTDGICIAFDSLEVNFITGYDLNLAGLNVGCNGSSDGNISSTPIGANAPYDFEWGAPINQITLDADADTIFNLSAGTYYLTVTDNSGCVQVDSFVLTVPPPLGDSAIINDLTCFGYGDGLIQVTPFGGTPPYDIFWYDFPFEDSTYITGLDTGRYEITITDASNCFVQDTFYVNQPSGIVYSKDSTKVSCYLGDDGSAEILVSSGGTPPYFYLWDDTDSQTTALATGLESGMYNFTVSDSNDCSVNGSVFVPDQDSFQISILTQDVSCFNSEDGVGLAGVGLDTFNYTFVWLTNQPISGAYTSQLPAGPITVEVTDTNNCVQTKDTIIGAPAPIVLDIVSDSVSCNGGADASAEVSVVSGGTAPFTYLWDDGDTDSVNLDLEAGIYYVTVTDVQGCESYDTVEIYEPAALVLDAQTQDVSCSGAADGQIEIYVSNGTSPYTYLWDDNSTNSFLYDLSQGTYYVTVTDNNGCVDSLDVEIVESPPIVIDELYSTPTNCPWSSDGGIFITVSGGEGNYNYDIGSSRNDQGNFNGLSSGSYSIEITDGRGCSVDTTITVEAPDSVNLTFDPDELFITLSEDTILNPIVDSNGRDIRYLWSPAATLSCDTCKNPVASPTVTTVYELTIYDENDCAYTNQITVNVDNSLILYVPNAFTPNGDEINDELKVYGVSLQSIDFRVFDRWGEQVFYTDDLEKGWDGKFKGEILPPDVYIYYLDAFYLDGQKKSMKGSVTLIK